MIFVIIGMVLAILAASLHAYIFVMESFTWTTAKTRRTFGLTEKQAIATKELAFNQGFYNLFLGIITVVGVALAPTLPLVGIALVLAGTGSMLAAAVVLLLSAPDKRRAAITQGTVPLLTVIMLVLAFVVS